MIVFPTVLKEVTNISHNKLNFLLEPTSLAMLFKLDTYNRLAKANSFRITIAL